MSDLGFSELFKVGIKDMIEKIEDKIEKKYEVKIKLKGLKYFREYKIKLYLIGIPEKKTESDKKVLPILLDGNYYIF